VVKPTSEFARQHDIEAPAVDARSFRQGWRVRSRLDQLLLDGRISRGEWQAANEFRTSWAYALQIGSLGALRWGRTGGVGDPHKRALDLLDAVERLQAVEEVIGSLASQLVFECVVRDAPWARTAAAYHRDPETIRDWTSLAIKALAVAWAGRRRAPTTSEEPD